MSDSSISVRNGLAVPSDAVPASAFLPLKYALIALGILIVGIGLRLHDLTTNGLWLDELWAATDAQLGLKDTLVAVIRLDVHPPLYYLQVNAWAFLFGRSDWALLTNSVFWSSATLVALLLATRRMVSMRVAILAMLLASFAAGEVYFAHELRMYTLTTFLTVLSWYCAWRFVDAPRRTTGIVLIVSVALLAASHAASVVPVSCVVMYMLIAQGLRRSLNWRTALMCVVLGLVTLPWFVNSIFRGVSHIEPLSFKLVTATFGGWFFGYQKAADLAGPLAGTLIVGVAVILALWSRPAVRTVALAFVVWPIFFVLLVSLLNRSLWIDRLFDFCVPFVGIVIAAAFFRIWDRVSAGPRGARPLLAALGCVLLVFMFLASARQGEAGGKMEYREAAAFLAREAQPGDIIYVPEAATFWGIARYFVGPSWGNALKIQDPVRPGQSASWDPVYARLGPVWLKRLDLVPETRDLKSRGVTLVIGWTPASEVEHARRVWLVGSGIVTPTSAHVCQAASDSFTQFRGVGVRRIDCATPGGT